MTEKDVDGITVKLFLPVNTNFDKEEKIKRWKCINRFVVIY